MSAISLPFKAIYLVGDLKRAFIGAQDALRSLNQSERIGVSEQSIALIEQAEWALNFLKGLEDGDGIIFPEPLFDFAKPTDKLTPSFRKCIDNHSAKIIPVEQVRRLGL